MEEYKSCLDSDFQIIEEIVNDIPISGKFILKISNGTDYFCSLCNYTIAHSPSDKKFRLSLWTHINEAIHRKNVRKVYNNNNKTNEKSKQDKKLMCTALDSFELSKQEKSMSSKKLIITNNEGNYYHCILCDAELTQSLNDVEFRFNLLAHINEKGHKFKLTTAHKNSNDKMRSKGKKDLNSKTGIKSCDQNKEEESEFLQGKAQKAVDENWDENEEEGARHQLSKSQVSVEILEVFVKPIEKERKHKRRTKYKVDDSDELNDFFDSLEQSNPVTVISKRFIEEFVKQIEKQRKSNKKTKKNKKIKVDSLEQSNPKTKGKKDLNTNAGIKSCGQNKEDKSEFLQGKAHISDDKAADENWNKNEEEGAMLQKSKSQVGVEILKEWGNMTLDEVGEVDTSNFKGRIKKQFVKQIEKERNPKKKANNNQLIHCDELNEFFDSLEHSNPVTVISKYLITKANNGKDYYCTICDVEINYPLNSNEFRFNLWSHINYKNHRENLPNYSDIIKSFQKEKDNISKSLPNAYKADADFFELGVHFRFATCSICNVAVSLNFYRITNHIKGKEHTENRRIKMLRQDVKKNAKVCSKREFAVLKPKIDGNFSKDMKFIQPGEMPGYVVCIVCCRVVLPTKHYLETHFEQECHVKNRSLRPVNKSSMNLNCLMQNIPNDLKGFVSMFVEDKCGVKCNRCQEVVPATTHDLYAHIIKERKNEKKY